MWLSCQTQHQLTRNESHFGLVKQSSAIYNVCYILFLLHVTIIRLAKITKLESYKTACKHMPPMLHMYM